LNIGVVFNILFSNLIIISMACKTEDHNLALKPYSGLISPGRYCCFLPGNRSLLRLNLMESWISGL